MNLIMGALTPALAAACAGFTQTPHSPAAHGTTEVFHLRTECKAPVQRVFGVYAEAFPKQVISYTAHASNMLNATRISATLCCIH
jgi:hypothetical protein